MLFPLHQFFLSPEVSLNSVSVTFNPESLPWQPAFCPSRHYHLGTLTWPALVGERRGPERGEVEGHPKTCPRFLRFPAANRQRHAAPDPSHDPDLQNRGRQLFQSVGSKEQKGLGWGKGGRQQKRVWGAWGSLKGPLGANLGTSELASILTQIQLQRGP